MRTLALGIDVKWGCLLLESEVWGQIRFLFVLGSKGTGNGGWSMKTKFYPKSMDPHWMRVYVGVHSFRSFCCLCILIQSFKPLSMEWMEKNLCYVSVCSCTNHISEVVIEKKSFVALSLPENDCIGHTIHKKTKFYVLKSMNVLYNTNLIWEHVMFMNPKFSACNKKI